GPLEIGAKGITARERHGLVAPRCNACRLEGGFDGGRGGGTGVMHPVFPATRAQQIAVDGIAKTPERAAQIVFECATGHTATQHLHEQRVVVPVVQRAGGAAEVDIVPAAGVGQYRTLGMREKTGVCGTGVITHMRLHPFQYSWFDHGLLPWPAAPVVRVSAPLKPRCPIPAERRREGHRAWAMQSRAAPVRSSPCLP